MIATAMRVKKVYVKLFHPQKHSYITPLYTHFTKLNIFTLQNYCFVYYTLYLNSRVAWISALWSSQAIRGDVCMFSTHSQKSQSAVTWLTVQYLLFSRVICASNDERCYFMVPVAGTLRCFTERQLLEFFCSLKLTNPTGISQELFNILSYPWTQVPRLGRLRWRLLLITPRGTNQDAAGVWYHVGSRGSRLMQGAI